MFDVVTFLLGVFPEVDTITPKSLQTLEWAGKHFAETPVKEVVEVASKVSPFGRDIKPVHRETFLPKVLDLFYLGVHRVTVVDSQNKIFNLITQSDVMAYLAQNIHLIKERANLTLESLKIGNQGAFTVTGDTTVIKALMTIHSKRLSAVPVVDNDGKLIANLSMSDLRGLNSKTLVDLLLPINDFLSKRASEDENYVCERSVNPLTVKLTDTLDYAIYKIVATRVHRLWAVDSAGKPVGVVALTDLMKAFVSYGTF